ncbi:a-factor receptor [Oleoguttula sp. CCFEE 5521]
MAMPQQPDSTATYPTAILLSVFALLISLLIIPPMLWHARNRNIGATSLIAWILILNIQIVLNALIWRNDNTNSWFSGTGLCDIEVKIQLASGVGFPSSAACVLRALARVMDTERTSMGKTRAQKKRGYAIDLLWCAGFPALQMLFHYVVQPSRYYIWGISGCVPSVSNSWVTDLLIIAPPVAWVLVCAVYAVLILIRLHRYRRNFSTLLANSNTNTSRFLRLFVLCIFWLLISLPLHAFILYTQAYIQHEPFAWSTLHSAESWSKVEMTPSGGTARYIVYIWLGSGLAVFMFFGWGRDAAKMYRQGLMALGLGYFFPGLRDARVGGGRQHSLAGTLSSVTSKAKLVFKRGSGVDGGHKSWISGSSSRGSKFDSTCSTDAEPIPPKTAGFPPATIEEEAHPSCQPTGSSWLRTPAQHDLETGTLPATRFERLTAAWKTPRVETMVVDHGIALGELAPSQGSVRSMVESVPRSIHMVGGKSAVVVRKEVRQGSARLEREDV